MKSQHYLPLSVLAAGVIIGGSILYVGFVNLHNNNSVGGVAVPTSAGGGQAQQSNSTLNLTNQDAVLGNANAPVTMIEYGDYECPLCGSFFINTEPQIIQNYVNTGKVKLVFRDFTFIGPDSLPAASATRCAQEQGKFWQMHDAIFKAEIAAANESGQNLPEPKLVQLAQTVGLNTQTFQACLDSNRYTSFITSEKTGATALGVNGTPTFFINGQEFVGAQPYASFQQQLDHALVNLKI